LLGILSEGFQYDSQGKLEVIAIPSALDFKTHTAIPVNLGVVIKASQLAAFRQVFEDMMKKKESDNPAKSQTNGDKK